MTTSLSNYFDLRWFFASLLAGICIVLLFTPPPAVVYRFPSPQTTKLVFETGEEGKCVKYHAVPVDCNNYPGRVKEQPQNTASQPMPQQTSTTTPYW